MMQQVRVKRVVLFLVLTFGLTWGFEWLVALTTGQVAYLKMQLNPMGMFFPAFSTLLLQMFVFKDSPLYFRTYKEGPRWVFYGFFVLTFLNGVVTVLALTTQIRTLILQGIGGILVMLWTLEIFSIYGKCGAASFERVGLSLGDKGMGVRFIAGVIVFLLSQAALNGLLGLGTFPGIQDNVGGVRVTNGLYPFALFVFFFISAIGTPLSSLAAVFGEEYGWRGFLHNELVKSRPRLGVFLVGLIWGIWHFPIILSGIHTYPPTATGLGMGVVFFVLVGFAFSYAVMKTKSLWVVSFMHGVMNSIYAFVLNYLIYPSNKVFSFGLGLYGLMCLAVIVLVILRDPVWRDQANQTEQAGAQ